MDNPIHGMQELALVHHLANLQGVLRKATAAHLHRLLMTILGVIGAFHTIRRKMYGWMMAGLAMVAQRRQRQPNLLVDRVRLWGCGGGTRGNRVEVVTSMILGSGPTLSLAAEAELQALQIPHEGHTMTPQFFTGGDAGVIRVCPVRRDAETNLERNFLKHRRYLLSAQSIASKLAVDGPNATSQISAQFQQVAVLGLQVLPCKVQAQATPESRFSQPRLLVGPKEWRASPRVRQMPMLTCVRQPERSAMRLSIIMLSTTHLLCLWRSEDGGVWRVGLGTWCSWDAPMCVGDEVDLCSGSGLAIRCTYPAVCSCDSTDAGVCGGSVIKSVSLVNVGCVQMRSPGPNDWCTGRHLPCESTTY